MIEGGAELLNELGDFGLRLIERRGHGTLIYGKEYGHCRMNHNARQIPYTGRGLIVQRSVAASGHVE